MFLPELPLRCIKKSGVVSAKSGKLDIEPLSMDIDVQLPSNRRDVFGRMVLTEDNKGYLLEQNHNGESTPANQKIFFRSCG
jgi:hypothetical protein